MPELDEAGLANALDVFGLAHSPSPDGSAADMEVRALVSGLRNIMQSHRDAVKERDSEAGHVLRLQEAADREESRTRMVRGDVDAARERLAALTLAVDEAQLIQCQGEETVTDFELGSRCLEVVQAEHAALQAEVLKARRIAADVQAEIERCRRALLDEQPRLDALRRELTETYVENNSMRCEIEKLRADLVNPPCWPQVAEDSSIVMSAECVHDVSEGSESGDSEPNFVLRIPV